MGTVVARYRLEQIVLAVGLHPLGTLLALEAGGGEIIVEQARRDLVAPDGFDRGKADKHLLSRVVRCRVDRAPRDLRLINLADGARLSRQLGPDPVELRRVDA